MSGDGDGDGRRAECEAAVDEVLRAVNTVRFLIRSVEEVSGRPFRRDRIRCVPRAAGDSGLGHSAAAGYMWQRVRKDCERGDILLVTEHMTRARADKGEVEKGGEGGGGARSVDPKTLEEVERNIRHELIHAFDDARGVIEPSDCTHQACSEIRAARLSGDCFVGNELRRGRFDPLHSGMKCVQRRATLALETNPVCRGFSERAVERVFRRCYSDYEPFAAPIYAMGSYGDHKFDLKL